MTTIRTQPMPVSTYRRYLSAATGFLKPALVLASRLLKLVILFLVLFVNVSQPKAQGGFFWSEQERIPEYFDATEEPPYMVADQNNTVHAFNAQPLDLNDMQGPKAVFYRQWTIDNGWTFPNDILYDVDGFGYSLVGVTSDATGRVHLLVQKSGGIYYVQNYLALAQNAASWPTPVFVAGNTQGFGPGYEIVSAIATDPTGEEIVIIFSGRQYGNGLYFTSSLDSGITWTEPYPIYLTGDELILVTDPKLFAGESGTIHAVWSTFLGTGAGGPGYYANFNMETQVWTEPIELDLPGIRTPSVIEYEGTIMVSYYHENINGNWWRLSNDGGKTWTTPTEVARGHIGTTGQVSFVVDSNNVLHAFAGNRINDANHGVWHSVWRNNNWTGPEAVVRGPEVRDVVGGNGFGPRSARAIVSNGNVLLVTWGTDGFQGTNGAWYSYKRIDAPELPAVITPVTEIVVGNGQSPTESPVPTEGANPTLDPGSEDPVVLDQKEPPFQIISDPQSQIITGVLPVLLLIIALVILQYYFSNRQR